MNNAANCWEDVYRTQTARIAELERENAALREDRARLDWLDGQEHEGEMRSMTETWHLSKVTGGMGKSIFAPHIRAAIDAARKEAQP